MRRGRSFFWLVNTGSVAAILVALTAMTIIASAMYWPQAALFAEMFGTRVRYTGASMGYQIGSVGGGLLPLIATSLFAATGTSVSISAYMAALCVVSFVSMFLVTETYKKDLAQTENKENKLISEAGGQAWT